MARREETSRRARGRPAPARRKLGLPAKALIVVGLVLAVFTDDRHAGKVGDARHMILTAVSITTTGEIGLARGFERLTVPRPGGDAVSRYGLGMALAQVPAAWLAPYLEKAAGPGASQTLFLLAPLAFGLLAAWAAGLAARSLGADERGQAFAVLLASLGSPLGSYATCDLSETLQAACIAGAFAASLHSVRAASRSAALRAAALAGLCAGYAVATKPNLLIVAPWALLPLLWRRTEPDEATTAGRVGAAALGAVPGLAIWVTSELVRFGGLFRGYGGESFSYPPLEGAIRLLVGPNKGVLLFFPALAVAVLEAVRRLRADAPADVAPGPRTARSLEVAAALVPFVVLWGTASAWWAWHGVAGWGPRLLVPALPGAAALAGAAVARWRPSRGRLFVGASIALNVLPLLQSSGPVSSYTARLASIPTTAETARRYGNVAWTGNAAARGKIPGGFVVHEVPAASDFVVYPWFLSVRAEGSVEARGRRLERPPWIGERPDLVPEPGLYDATLVGLIAPPLGFGFLGRSALGGDDPVRGEAYAQALSVQVLRAQQQRKLDRALALALRLHELNPRGDSVALVAESYRLLGRHEMLRAFLDYLPREVRGTPPVLAVVALAARDVGEADAARAYMAKAAAGLSSLHASEAAARPPAEWPADYASLISRDATDVAPALPRAGGADAVAPVSRSR